MATRKLVRHWFQTDCSFFLNTKIQLAGPFGAFPALYTLACARQESDFTDGALPLDKWDARRIKLWLGVTGSSFSAEQIQEGMDGLIENNVIIIDKEDETFRFKGYEDWHEDRERELTRRRVAKHRGKQKESPRDCNGKNVTKALHVTERNGGVTQCNVDEMRLDETREDIYITSNVNVNDKNTNNEVELTPVSSCQSTVAKKIQEHWPGYRAQDLVEASVKLSAYYPDEKAVCSVLDEAVKAWEPGRNLYGAGGLYTYLYRWLTNNYEKHSSVQSDGSKKKGRPSLEERQRNLMARVEANEQIDLGRVSLLIGDVARSKKALNTDFYQWINKLERKGVLAIDAHGHVSDLRCEQPVVYPADL